MTGRAPSGQALVASDQAATRLAPSGFDPSRWSREWGDEFLRVTKRHLPTHFAGWWKKWGSTARFWRSKSLARAAYEDGFAIGARAAYIALAEVQAIAMEARQGGDAQQAPSASADDSAGPKDIAQ